MTGLSIGDAAMRDAHPLTAADVMTATEVADLVRVPRSTVEDWARRDCASRKIGRPYVRHRVETLLLGETSAGEG